MTSIANRIRLYTLGAPGSPISQEGRRCQDND